MAKADDRREIATAGHRIKILRAVVGESQRDVAAATGVDTTTLCLYETGARAIPKDAAQKLGLHFFGVAEPEAEER